MNYKRLASFLIYILLESGVPLSACCPGSRCFEQRIEQDTEIQQKRVALLEGKIKQQSTSREGLLKGSRSQGHSNKVFGVFIPIRCGQLLLDWQLRWTELSDSSFCFLRMFVPRIQSLIMILMTSGHVHRIIMIV